MRLLLVEHWNTGIYAEPYAQRFREYGHNVEAFEEHRFFEHPRWRGWPARWIQRVECAQEKYRLGPSVWRLNEHLVEAARRFRPDVVFVFRGAFVWPRTVEKLKTLGAVVIAWNNVCSRSGLSR